MDFEALEGDQGAIETGFLKPMPLHVISQELSVPGLASTCAGDCFINCWFILPSLNITAYFEFSPRHLLCDVYCSLCVKSEWTTQKPGLPISQRHEDYHLVLDIYLQ